MSTLVGSQADGLNSLRSLAETENHLLPRERDPDRAIQRDGGHRRQEQLILRPEPGAEGAADEGGHDAHLVLGEAEDIAHIAVAVLRALRLVIDGQAFVFVPTRRAAQAFHGIMVLHRRAIFVRFADRRLGQSLVGIAALSLGVH